MAALCARVVNKRREKITALPVYHNGHLLKKYTGEKDFRNFFAELRGSTLFLYEDDNNEMYSERVELHTLKAMEVDSPHSKIGPSVYTLTLLNEEVQLKFDNPNTAEEWRGFIMTVATLQIPRKLQLLPGQLLTLKTVLEKECRRTGRLPSPVPVLPRTPRSPVSPGTMTDDTLADFPSCFYHVSRQEAEQMLEDNPEYGSIILRPSAGGSSYAITMRQIFPRSECCQTLQLSAKATSSQ
ncbi:signal-transducing adaptor protein 1-like [Megalops cyprinoides]|uniref:signal-transducing adaptor protein 1-like n=1 Tax=Megalops cyprinoides TaxID=118141 RepID=UPI001863F02E|nr:signal-transducing adaptor protein 1-like [Megalops cyprinoides]